jgi:hypothetical protein
MVVMPRLRAWVSTQRGAIPMTKLTTGGWAASRASAWLSKSGLNG